MREKLHYLRAIARLRAVGLIPRNSALLIQDYLGLLPAALVNDPRRALWGLQQIPTTADNHHPGRGLRMRVSNRTATQRSTTTTFDPRTDQPYLFDEGSANSFISYNSTNQLLGSIRQIPDQTITLADGSTTTAGAVFTTTIRLAGQDCNWTFTILHTQCSLIFGHDFLRAHQAIIRHSDHTVEFTLPHQGTIRVPLKMPRGIWI